MFSNTELRKLEKDKRTTGEVFVLFCGSKKDNARVMHLAELYFYFTLLYNLTLP